MDDMDNDVDDDVDDDIDDESLLRAAVVALTIGDTANGLAFVVTTFFKNLQVEAAARIALEAWGERGNDESLLREEGDMIDVWMND